jgi:hypothetical protein
MNCSQKNYPGSHGPKQSDGIRIHSSVIGMSLLAMAVSGENVRAFREKSGNHLLANLPTCSYKYVFVTHTVCSVVSLPWWNKHLFRNMATIFCSCCSYLLFEAAAIEVCWVTTWTKEL